MALKYKDLEALAARQLEAWMPVDFHLEVSRFNG